ncbi:uncharacterized protein LOC134842223 isoform X2 [Symsagittifera roscoffensis]
MYFEVQFDCYSYKTVCASLESAQKLLFTGVKAGEVSTSECPDVKILGNVAKEKCLGRDSWDSSLSKPCPESWFNRAAFKITNSNGKADEVGMGWEMLHSALKNQSSSVDLLEAGRTFYEVEPIEIRFKDLLIDLYLTRVEFFSALLYLNVPKYKPPRLTFNRASIYKPVSCLATDYVIAFGTVDLASYTDLFNVKDKIAGVFHFSFMSEANCNLLGANFGQNVTIDVLQDQEVLEDSNFMSECIMWPSSSLKSLDFEMRKPLKCKSEWLNSYRTKCFCEPVANDLFFTVVKVAKPTSTIAPSTTTSNLTAAPASTTQPLSNSTNQSGGVTEVTDSKETTSRNGTLEAEELDLQWIMFYAGMALHAFLVYLIPVTILANSAYGKLKKSCSLFWSQSTTRVNNNPQKLSFIANKRQSKLKSAEHHAGTDSVSLVDKTECMMNDNGVNVVGEVDADKCEVDRGSEQYRYLFVLYGPLSAFMAASASVAILMCSCAVRKDQLDVSVGFTVENFFLSSSWFLILFAPILDLISNTHSIMLKLALPIMFSIVFTIVVFGVASSFTAIERLKVFTFCWIQASTEVLGPFAIPIIIFLLIVIFLFNCAQCRKNDDSKLISRKVGVVWVSLCFLLLLQPVLLFLLASDWSIEFSGLLLLANLSCPITAIAICLRVWFTKLHIIEAGLTRDSRRSEDGRKEVIVLETLDETNLSCTNTDDAIPRKQTLGHDSMKITVLPAEDATNNNNNTRDETETKVNQSET